LTRAPLNIFPPHAPLGRPPFFLPSVADGPQGRLCRLGVPNGVSPSGLPRKGPVLPVAVVFSKVTRVKEPRLRCLPFLCSITLTPFPPVAGPSFYKVKHSPQKPLPARGRLFAWPCAAKEVGSLNRTPPAFPPQGIGTNHFRHPAPSPHGHISLSQEPFSLDSSSNHVQCCSAFHTFLEPRKKSDFPFASIDLVPLTRGLPRLPHFLLVSACVRQPLTFFPLASRHSLPLAFYAQNRTPGMQPP